MLGLEVCASFFFPFFCKIKIHVWASYVIILSLVVLIVAQVTNLSSIYIDHVILIEIVCMVHYFLILLLSLLGAPCSQIFLIHNSFTYYIREKFRAR